MRYAAWSLLPAALLLVWVVCGPIGAPDRTAFLVRRAEAAEPSGAKRSGPPPLKVDRSAPLLLDSLPSEDKSTAEKKSSTKGPVADNSACHVCHGNYDQESLAVEHAKVNIGCVECHGQSIAHRNDEDNITPPDIMYPVDRIDAACVKCHETHDAPAKKVLAAWQKRCPAKEKPDELVCTDCHGEHRLRFRTVWWDRKTGKLADRKGQRVKYAPDYTQKPGQKQTPAKPKDNAGPKR